jgi:pimeloyl-ACP methyl ester carboxylesterase
MTRTILIPGNPIVVDLEPFARSLGATTVARPACGGTSLGDLVAAIDRALGGQPTRVVAYSFGSWLVLQHQRSGQKQPASLILVNPYLAAERPVSRLAAAVATAPLVGATIMGRKAPRLAADFVHRTFSPAPPPAGVGDRMREALSRAEVWQAALRDKRVMQRHPLTTVTDLSCPVTIVRGAADGTAEWERQTAVLEPVMDRVKVVVIPGAGHGLPWTHAEEIAGT